jgi:hypothetical protein
MLGSGGCELCIIDVVSLQFGPAAGLVKDILMTHNVTLAGWKL